MRCFLSHSSQDKSNYVRHIAAKLGQRAIIDESSFVAGEITLAEIMRHLDATDLFVLFLSNASLESEWVRKELNTAYEKLSRREIQKILPLIVDPTINHKDKRIPDWMRESYNLQYIARPTVALRLIEAALRELGYERHPALAARDRLFVGRNDLMAQIEQRFDDFSKKAPFALVASGLDEIGRKTLLQRGFEKANITRDTFIPRIALTQVDGIEGFIRNIADLGLTATTDTASSIYDMSSSDKQAYAQELVDELAAHNEIVLIEDDRCIVQIAGKVADWFVGLADNRSRDQTVFGVASRLRPHFTHKTGDHIFHVPVPELSVDERVGLLGRYLRDVAKKPVASDDIAYFRGILKGYPGQSIYTAEMISAEGIDWAKKNTDLVTQYAINKAGLYVRKYEEDELALSTLKFMSWFEFVSWTLLDKVGKALKEDLSAKAREFVEEAICELFGVSGEYVRVNDVIRDYVSRNELTMDPEYRGALNNLSQELFREHADAKFDLSEIDAAVKVALESGKQVPERLLVPAHLLSAVMEKYDRRQLGEAIQLADRILERDNLDQSAMFIARYYLCQALARQRSERFLQEVQHIKGAEHEFLMGFYYRFKGRYDAALERYKRAAQDPAVATRAEREIILVYSITEDYSSALDLARESYESHQNNALLIQSYFELLLHVPRDGHTLTTLESLLRQLNWLQGRRADEVREVCKAKYAFFIENAPQKAFDIIDIALAKSRMGAYLLRTKLELATVQADVKRIDECTDTLRDSDIRETFFDAALAKAAVIKAAASGDLPQAESILENRLGTIHPEARVRLWERAKQLSTLANSRRNSLQ